MKKIISLLIALTLCLSVLPVGITVFADEPVKYTEAFGTHINNWITANGGGNNYFVGNAEVAGTYGTFYHELTGNNVMQHDGGNGKLTIQANSPNRITYKLDKIEGKQFADLHAATGKVYIRYDVGTKEAGVYDMRYMYVSDDNYFAIRFDYTNVKVYGVVMDNGKETLTEIPVTIDSTVENGLRNTTLTASLTIEEGKVSCSVTSGSGLISASHSFNVSNIEYLRENCTAVSQIYYTPATTGPIVSIGEMSHTCSVKDYVAPDAPDFTTYAEDMTANMNAWKTANNAAEISGSGTIMPGTYGSFSHALKSSCGVQIAGGVWRLHTYTAGESTVTYNLDGIKGKEMDEFGGATATVKSVGSNDVTDIGVFEARYLYVSDNDWFGIRLDYVNKKVYAVVKNNGTETATEITGDSLLAGTNSTETAIEISVSGTTASYNVGGVTGSFVVENIKSLENNCTAMSQFVFNASTGLKQFYLSNVSHTCTVQDVVEKSTYADDIAAAFTASGDNELTYADANKTTQGSYGTYVYTLTQYASAKNDYGTHRLYTYDAGESTISYNLDKIEGMKLDKLYDASVKIRANKGIADMRYLYKSANDWFGIRLDNSDTAAPKAYAVVKNNGTETKTEIGAITLDGTIQISISIDDTTVSYVVGTMNGTFEVANMADLQENYQYVWQLGFNTNGEKRLYISAESLTCSIKVAPQIFTEDFESYTSENAAVGTITTYRRYNDQVVVTDKCDLNSAEDKANGFTVAENDKSIWKLSKFLDGQSDGMRYESAAFIDQTQHGSDDGWAQTNKNDNRLSLLRGWNYSAVNLYLKEDVYDIQKISFQISSEVLDAIAGVRFMVGHGEKTAYELGSLKNAKFYTGKRTGLWENSRSGYAAGTSSNGIQATFDKVEAETEAMAGSGNYSEAQYLAYFNVVITMKDTGYDYMVTKANGGEVVFSGTFEDPSGTRLKPVKGAPVLQFVGLDKGGVVASLDNIRIEYEAVAGTKAVSNSAGGIDVTYAPYQLGERVSFVTVWMNDQDQVVATTIETADDTTSISKTIAIDAPEGATKATVYTWKGEADNVKPLYATGVNVSL